MSDELAQARALQELQTKTLKQIQVETAQTWAWRAWAARQLARQANDAGDSAAAVSLLHDAVEYSHEAIEHAALCGNDLVLSRVRAIAYLNA